MSIGAILIVGSIISFIVTFAFTIKITDLDFRIDRLEIKAVESKEKIAKLNNLKQELNKLEDELTYLKSELYDLTNKTKGDRK